MTYGGHRDDSWQQRQTRYNIIWVGIEEICSFLCGIKRVGTKYDTESWPKIIYKRYVSVGFNVMTINSIKNATKIKRYILVIISIVDQARKLYLKISIHPILDKNHVYKPCKYDQVPLYCACTSHYVAVNLSRASVNFQRLYLVPQWQVLRISIRVTSLCDDDTIVRLRQVRLVIKQPPMDTGKLITRIYYELIILLQ